MIYLAKIINLNNNINNIMPLLTNAFSESEGS